MEAGRDYVFPNEAWGTLHWWNYTEEFELDLPLDGSGLLRISTYSAEGIAGTYSVNFQGGGSISGSFEVSFVAGFD